MSSEPDSESEKRRPLTARARHIFGNGNTLKTLGAIVAIAVGAVTLGLAPRCSDIYTRAEAKEHATQSAAVHDKLDARVTATEKAVTKLETIERILTERLPPPRKR